MSSKSLITSLNLLLTIKILLVIQSPNASTNPDQFYDTCNNTYTCGNNIARIGYPFRGSDDPPYCGHPSFVLTCDALHNVTTLDILSTTYRVLEIRPAAQTMRIVRDDLMENGTDCPRETENATLDRSVFDYSGTYVNLTFLYGCSSGSDIPGSSLVPCGDGDDDRVYVLFPSGNRVPAGNCNASVVVPVLGNGLVNGTGLDRVIQQGFEIRWKVDSDAYCGGCTESNGRCGFSFESNTTTCFCPDPPYVSDVCPMASGASDGNRGSSGSNRSTSTTGRNIGLFIAGGVLAGIGVGWLVFYYRQRRKQRLHRLGSQSSKDIITTTTSSTKPLTTPPSTDFTASALSFTTANSDDLDRDSAYFGVQVFSYAELEEATNNFDPSRVLGDGGFGTVYYGVLPGGRIVAVKCLYDNNFKRVEQFMNEVEILTQLRHKNLVILHGCTSKRSRELLLVYEYVSNGTIADHLNGRRAKSGLLSWPVRMKVAIETAEALDYLHKSGIIHRDVKTNNILLDNDFHVKVADFGLSRLFPTDVTHVSTAPQGTPGYVDPEYYQCYQLTEKSDVYSFGVVLVELISSLQAVDTNRHRHDINLANMAVNKIQNHTLHELVDSSLGFDTDSRVRRMATLVAELAFRCLQQERDMRPSMEQVLEGLRGIQNEELNAHKVEIVDLLTNDDTGPLKGSVTPPSPDSASTEKSAPNSSG